MYVCPPEITSGSAKASDVTHVSFTILCTYFATPPKFVWVHHRRIYLVPGISFRAASYCGLPLVIEALRDALRTAVSIMLGDTPRRIDALAVIYSKIGKQHPLHLRTHRSL